MQHFQFLAQIPDPREWKIVQFDKISLSEDNKTRSLRQNLWSKSPERGHSKCSNATPMPVTPPPLPPSVKTFIPAYVLYVFLAWLFSKKVCYQKYGCFKRQPNILIKLPQSPSRIGIRFNLFTRANRNSANLIDDHNKNKLTSSHFKISRRTIFVIHGYTGKGQAPGDENLKHSITAY